jgi:hypothetical protein
MNDNEYESEGMCKVLSWHLPGGTEYKLRRALVTIIGFQTEIRTVLLPNTNHKRRLFSQLAAFAASYGALYYIGPMLPGGGGGGTLNTKVARN